MSKAQNYAKAARFLPRFLRSPVNKYLYRRFHYDFIMKPEIFRGQRVLLIGPARTVEDDLSAIETSGYDIVIKMNNSLDTPIHAGGLEPFQCDVLFHSLTSDVRPITSDMLKRANVRLLVHRTPKRSAFLSTLLASDRYSDACSVKNIPFHFYDELSEMLDGAAPTTGLVCSRFFLDAPIREIAIVGFTFFSTSYVDGYNDTVATDEEAIARVEDTGHHVPRLEARLLFELVELARGRGTRVILGKNLVDAAASFGVGNL